MRPCDNCIETECEVNGYICPLYKKYQDFCLNCVEERRPRMKATTTFERLNPTTADGDLIKVTTIYSSFNKEEIDNLQADLRNSIGAGITIIGGRE